MAPPRAIARLACLVGMLATSCTAGAPPPAPRPPTQLIGQLLSVTTDQTASSLVRYRPADASSQTIDSPIDPEAVNRSTIAGIAAADGALFVAANSKALQAYSLPTGADEVQEIGPSLDVRSVQEPSVQISEAGAVVADCHGVFVLPLPAADEWRWLGRSCWAALDPAGSTVAFEFRGHVLARSIGGTATTSLLFDLSDLSDELGTQAPPRLVGVPSWGPAGLAFFVRAGDQLGVFVRTDAGDVVEVLQERYANVYRVPRLAWQPDGTILAISDDVGPFSAVLRTFDMQTHELHALSMFSVGYSGMQWAPDGTSIAVLTGTGVLLVVDLGGDWLLRRETDWNGLIGWDAVS